MKRIACAGALALACGALAAQTTLEIPQAGVAPTLDGELSEGEWDDAATVTGLRRTDNLGFAREQTRFYLKWDADFIYLAAVCADSNVKDLHLKSPYDDCLEIFLQATGSGDVTHWLLSANGKATGILVDAEFGSGLRKPHGSVTSAVKANEGDWTLECRIPAESVGRQPFGRHPLRFNACRSFNESGHVRRDGRGPEYGCFAPVSGQLFKPLDFAELKFGGRTGEPVRQLKADESGCAFAPMAGARTLAVTNGASVTWTVIRGDEIVFKNRYDRPAEYERNPGSSARQSAAEGLGLDVVGSMRRVYAQDPYFGENRSVSLSAARNEREAFQIVSFAGTSGVRSVTFEPGALRTAAGDVIPAERWTLYREGTMIADPVGYPTTHGPGEYPDPLYPIGPFDLAPMQVQPVWAEIRTAETDRPGEYEGEILVRQDGRPVGTVRVRLTVWDFALPKRQSFRTAFNVWEREFYRLYFEGKGRPVSELIDVVDAYATMLADHRLTPSVFRNPNLLPPDVGKAFAENYDRLVAKYLKMGAAAFYIGPEIPHSDYRKIEEKPWKEMWKRLYDRYRGQGLIEYAYAYPFDEPGNEQRAIVNRATSWIREVAPDLKIMLTGATTKMPAAQFDNIDIWVPASHWVNWRNKEMVQEKGTEVWWYPCSGPWYPYPNYHLDIEPGAWRIQTWMSWKWKFDGILYWATAFFNVKDTRRNNSYSDNGEGVLQYHLPGGNPAPSIRLKVICDSMEDYEYFVLLDATVRRLEGDASRREFVTRAKKLLEMDDMVRSMDDYCLEGERYDAVRREMARLIQEGSAGVAAAAEPKGYEISDDYVLSVNGKPTEVIRVPMPEVRLAETNRHPYSYAPITAAEPVEISLESRTFDLGRAVVLPESKGVKGTWRDGRLMFRMTPPQTLVVEPNGRHGMLVIAASKPEANVPDPKDPKVRYFGPGVHRPEKIRLQSDETLYLAPGAWVEGIVVGTGDNITVCGSGILSGAPWAWRKGPVDEKTNINRIGHLLTFTGNNLTVRDVTAFSSFGWTTVLNNVTNAVVENYKIISGRCVNDDGIDLSQTKNVVVRNSFARTQDDCIAPKWAGEDLVVSNCTFVTDESNIVRVGYECNPGGSFRNLLFKDIDVLHLAMAKRGPELYWSNCAMLLQASHEGTIEDVTFDGWRLHEYGEGDVFFLAKTMSIGETGRCFTQDGGRIRNVTVRNPTAPVKVTRDMLHCIEKDAGHTVTDVKLVAKGGEGAL